MEYKRSTGCTKKADAQGFESRWRTAIESGATKPRTYVDALERYRPPESMRSHTRNTWELAPYPLTEVVAAAHEMRDRMLDEGYTRENCRVVCYIANLAMSQFGEDALTILSRAVVDRDK